MLRDARLRILHLWRFTGGDWVAKGNLGRLRLGNLKTLGEVQETLEGALKDGLGFYSSQPVLDTVHRETLTQVMTGWGWDSEKLVVRDTYHAVTDQMDMIRGPVQMDLAWGHGYGRW